MHAHDEFEVDIDVDTDMTRVASELPVRSLFDDDEDEATQEISVDQLEEQLRPKSDAEVPVLYSVESDDLPMFMPARAQAPLPPPPLTPPLIPPFSEMESEADLTQPDQSQPGPPDLSNMLDEAPASQALDLSSMPDLSSMLDEAPPPPPIQNQMSPSADDLFNDVSDIHDLPPIHDLKLPPSEANEPLVDLPPVPAPPPTTTGESKSKAKFGTGFTSGMQPLNVAQFEPSDPAGQDQSSGRKRLRHARGGPAPMAGSKRVKRRWSQFGLRDMLLVLLIALVAVGIFVGWSIYQDLKKQRDWEAFGQGRNQLEQTRTDAIEATTPKKEQDDP